MIETSVSVSNAHLNISIHEKLIIMWLFSVMRYWKLKMNNRCCFRMELFALQTFFFFVEAICLQKKQKKRKNTKWLSGCAVVGLGWSVCICWSLQDQSSVEKAWLPLCWVQQYEQNGHDGTCIRKYLHNAEGYLELKDLLFTFGRLQHHE